MATLMFRTKLHPVLPHIRRVSTSKTAHLIIFYIIIPLIFLLYQERTGVTGFYGTGLGKVIIFYALWLYGVTIFQDLVHNHHDKLLQAALTQLYPSPQERFALPPFNLFFVCSDHNHPPPASFYRTIHH